MLKLSGGSRERRSHIHNIQELEQIALRDGWEVGRSHLGGPLGLQQEEGAGNGVRKSKITFIWDV